MATPTIVSCKIGPYPKRMFDPMPAVNVVLSDDTEEELFEFYPDELSFTEAEFIGLTVDEAYELRRRKDVAYLRS